MKRPCLISLWRNSVDNEVAAALISSSNLKWIGHFFRCQAHFTALGANYPAARQCIVAHQGQITAAANCARSSFGNMWVILKGQKRTASSLFLIFFPLSRTRECVRHEETAANIYSSIVLLSPKVVRGNYLSLEFFLGIVQFKNAQKL